MVSIRLSGGACGAIVEDIDLATDLSDDLMRQLTGALYDHRCLIIKKQSLTREEYYRFASEWGSLIRHVVNYLRTPGFPEMMTIGNTEAKDRDAAVRNGAVAWHTDGAYIEDPTTMTMLHAVRVPKAGGETMIADMVAAYEALDPSLKSMADSLNARHFYGGGAVAEDERPASPMDPNVARETKDVSKSLVLDHPVTGRRALYAVAQTPVRVEGMSEAESRELLARLKAHATSPAFVFEHRYEIGDILIFDTLMTLHRAKSPIETAQSPEAKNARLLWRLSAKGLPRVHQASVAS